MQTLPPRTKINFVKNTKSIELKSHLEDDLQGINTKLEVVSESEDLLQFPHSDEFIPYALVKLPGENSPKSLVDDAKHNPGSSPHFIPVTKDTTMDTVGVNFIGLVSRGHLTQLEGGINRHESLTRDKRKGKEISSGETTFP